MKTKYKKNISTAPIRSIVKNLKESEIRTIANKAMNKKNIIPLWFGEDELPSSNILIEEGIKALRDGKTFYTENKGTKELCSELSKYLSKLYNNYISTDKILITASGMSGLMLAAEAIIEPYDQILAVTPVWPNFMRCVEIMGGRTKQFPLELKGKNWQLNINKLLNSSKKMKAIYINSPNNPTGWMINQEEQKYILDFCRKNGIWLIADEVYSRIVYKNKYAPSFLDIYKEDDPLIVINSFSKAWSMTGWRLGWMVLPKSIVPIFEKLNEFNVASANSIAQVTGIKALKKSEVIIKDTISRFKSSRELLVKELNKNNNIEFGYPNAAFYLFFRIKNIQDTLKLSHKIVDEVGVGLAPGIAFGKHFNSFIRICFAKSNKTLKSALKKIGPYIN